jgi:beta-xylosidase
MKTGVLAVLTVMAACAQEATMTTVSNPVIKGAADPHAMVVGRTVWVYPTFSFERKHTLFFAFSSDDLKTWQRHGPLLDINHVPWVKEDGSNRHYAWAPCIVEQGGSYYLYYSVGPQNPTPSRLGVAVADNPAGPFRDSGQALLTGGHGFEAIDPMVFKDPKSGKHYLHAGGSAGRKLRVFELNPDMVSFAREIPVKTPPNFTEGAFMHERNGIYYLSYSWGAWNRSSYSVHYATADSPTGPWTYRGAILSSNDTAKGPGHHSIIRHPVTNEWLIVYHRWEKRGGDGPFRGSRDTCIDRLTYAENGLLLPVVMTRGK